MFQFHTLVFCSPAQDCGFTFCVISNLLRCHPPHYAGVKSNYRRSNGDIYYFLLSCIEINPAQNLWKWNFWWISLSGESWIISHQSATLSNVTLLLSSISMWTCFIFSSCQCGFLFHDTCWVTSEYVNSYTPYCNKHYHTHLLIVSGVFSHLWHLKPIKNFITAHCPLLVQVTSATVMLTTLALQDN